MSRRELFLVSPPLLLGVLLAVSNVRLARENRQLNDTAQYFASLRHTRAGMKLPALHGKGLDGQDLTISYKDGDPGTVLFVFSPTCPHCKRNWPVWLDLAKAAQGKRVVFVNVGGPLPPNFSQLYSFDSATVVAAASPESMIQYSLFEFPITILVSADGHAENVRVGELSSTDVADIEKGFGSSSTLKSATERHVQKD
jgi:thiol-disulfide isomerase/thioredoxin